MTLKLVTSWFGLSVRAEGASEDTIVGGLEFVLFTSGSKTLVVAIGRAGQAYQYPAPVLRFGQTCALANARSVEWVQTALDMPGKPGENGIRFVQPCASVAWSGAILRDAGFDVNKANRLTPVAYTIRNSGEMEWSRDKRLQHLEMQYRPAGCVGPTCWIKDKVLNHTDRHYITDSWRPPAEDGTYDIRVLAVCKGSGNPDYDTGSTPILSGKVDRAGPVLVTVYSSSRAKTVGKQDVVTAILTEELQCDDRLGKDPLIVQLIFAKTILSLKASQLRVVCNGNRIVIARNQGFGDVQGLAAQVVIRNVKDRSGNLAEPIKTELVDSAASVTLNAIATATAAAAKARAEAEAAKRAEVSAKAAVDEAKQKQAATQAKLEEVKTAALKQQTLCDTCTAQGSGECCGNATMAASVQQAAVAVSDISAEVASSVAAVEVASEMAVKASAYAATASAAAAGSTEQAANLAAASASAGDGTAILSNGLLLVAFACLVVLVVVRTRKDTDRSKTGAVHEEADLEMDEKLSLLSAEAPHPDEPPAAGWKRSWSMQYNRWYWYMPGTGTTTWTNPDLALAPDKPDRAVTPIRAIGTRLASTPTDRAVGTRQMQPPPIKPGFFE